MDNQLTLSLEEHPASRSASQALEKDWTIRVVIWPSSFLELLRQFAPVGWSGRTCPGSCRRNKDGILAPSSGRWLNSGMGGPTESLTLNILEYPSGGVACSLSDILETGDLPQRYYLSATACRGILRRAEKRGRELPPALRGYAGRRQEDDYNLITQALGCHRGGPDDNKAQGGFYVPEICAQAMSAKWSKGSSGPAGDEHHNLIAHQLTRRYDSSEDGTGRGTPIIPIEENKNASTQERNTRKILRILREKIGEKNFTEWVLGILNSFQQKKILQSDMYGASLRCKTNEEKCWMDDGTLSCSKNNTTRDMLQMWETECERCSSYRRKFSEQYRTEFNTIMQKLSSQDSQSEEIMHDLWESSEGIGVLQPSLFAIQRKSFAVRRLTPREAERLQGFSDDYTLIPWRGKPSDKCPDGPRYKALGNSMAVPVMRWLSERISAVEAIK